MNIFEEAAKVLLGLFITGLFGAICWLFKWVDKVRLTLRDIERDISHLKRQNLTLSSTVANLDVQDEKIISSLRKALSSADRRMSRSESRIYVLEVRVNETITQVLDRKPQTLPLDEA